MFRSLTSLMFLANAHPAELPSTFQAPPAIIELVEVSPIPQRKEGKLMPDIEAKAALLMDSKTGLVLYDKNAHEPLPMASLTKIMTAILILENHDLNEVVPVDNNYADLEGVKVFLHRGEEMTVGNLLKALLIPSAGDAAMVLAEYHSGSVDQFVEEMNHRAKELNLTQTYFRNPVGLDEENHVSSAYDLAQLSRYAMQLPAFADIVRSSSASISSVDGMFSYQLESTNDLLGSYLNILGIKTGTTDEAGESLINLARGDQNQEIIAVLLNSPDRFQENKSMIDWAFRSYLW